MERRNATLLRAADVAGGARTYTQTLNPRSRFRGTELATLGGLARARVSHATLPAGAESFAYHAHDVQEEWMYVLSGEGLAIVDGKELPIGPGDFLAFPAPQVPHLVRNPGPGELSYLMGGERPATDVLTYPESGCRYLVRGEDGRAAFYRLDAPEFPFREE
ncbi:MAG TPA: cupin domain-containing protein [Anaeromyxobacteraceae bacterium]|nr:cupin domain-containing protein [Anaeromyxobacteraceae bacterium]